MRSTAALVTVDARGVALLLGALCVSFVDTRRSRREGTTETVGCRIDERGLAVSLGPPLPALYVAQEGLEEFVDRADS